MQQADRLIVFFRPFKKRYIRTDFNAYLIIDVSMKHNVFTVRTVVD